MGYVFRLEDAKRYTDWEQSNAGLFALKIEKELLRQLWLPMFPQRVLEVGCGTGFFLEWFAELGHEVTGIEPSQAMVDVAKKRLPGRISVDRGYAESLPYENNAFDTVALINTLEFVDNPAEALSEAIRVARRQVLVGALNKFSLATGHRYLERIWKRNIYSHARFFSVFALKHLAYEALAGSVPTRWRTCLTFPLFALPYTHSIERSRLLQWHPFGHFIGMCIDMRYPVQTAQHPLFSDLKTKIRGAAPVQPSCWNSSSDDAELPTKRAG